jgi:hypothetical protein
MLIKTLTLHSLTYIVGITSSTGDAPGHTLTGHSGTLSAG